MHRTLAILSSLAAIVSAIGVTGCASSSGSGSQQVTCNANPSFKTDVMPVFQQSCTLSSVCHGQMGNSAEENLFLGENAMNTDADISATYAQLVNVKAKEIPSMNLVTPGDLNNSFLWHKVHDSISDLTSNLGMQCAKATAMCTDCTAAQPCGSTMPYQSNPIDPMFACTLQNWIMNGAMNN